MKKNILIQNQRPEVGRVVHLEHFNFEVLEHEMATVFFMKGLGLTRDPYQRTDETNMGINIGLQQFHLPRRGRKTPPFIGEIGLVVPDLIGIQTRLEQLKSLGVFEGTSYAYKMQGQTALVTSPYGIKIRLHPSGLLPFLYQLGMAYVEFPVPKGLTSDLAAFYQETLGCPIESTTLEGDSALLVTMGPYQYIRFREKKRKSYDFHNFHIAFYSTHFNELRQIMIDQGAFLQEGRGQTFFFDKIFHPDSKKHLFTLQHEVRGVFHPDFMRPLINRWPLVRKASLEDLSTKITVQINTKPS